jgi:hypothetical protein
VKQYASSHCTSPRTSTPHVLAPTEDVGAEAVRAALLRASGIVGPAPSKLLNIALLPGLDKEGYNNMSSADDKPGMSRCHPVTFLRRILRVCGASMSSERAYPVYDATEVGEHPTQIFVFN